MWTGNQFEIDVEFIRHGQTLSNEQKKYISFSDEHLTDVGACDIKSKVADGYYNECDVVYTSNLIRTIETANIIFGGRLTKVVDDLSEINFGDFENKSYLDLKDNNDYKKWLESNCECAIPNGEKKADFINRQVLAFKRILLESKDVNNVSIVAHGGTAMAVISSFTDLNYFDCMLSGGEKIDAHVSYEIKGNDDVSISCFSITYRDNS